MEFHYTLKKTSREQHRIKSNPIAHASKTAPLANSGTSVEVIVELVKIMVVGLDIVVEDGRRVSLLDVLASSVV